MNISIKKRIYYSFSLLVCLFVINGLITIFTLNHSKKLSANISTVTDPSLQSIEDFEDILVLSKMYTTNWIFLRANQEDKDALRQLHNVDYPRLKKKLNLLSSKWSDTYMVDSLNKIYGGFEEVLAVERTIMSSLQKFDDYNDPVAKMESERLLEDEILPRTSSLINGLSNIISFEINIRNQSNKDLERSSIQLRILILILAITIILIGVFLSLYMAKKIINPINKIRRIVNDLGKGKVIMKVNHQTSNDEIGEMVRSVNNLAEKLHGTAEFAMEIGNRNFESHFEPLSNEDALGKALVAMRDNIKLSDEKLNVAQHIAHIGSWERILKTDDLILSDEIFNIFDVDPASFDFKFISLFNLIHPDDITQSLEISKKNLHREPLPYECRIVTRKGVIKHVYVQTKIIRNENGEAEKTFGIVQDITERKQAEEKITAEKELFRVMIESMPDQIYLKDKDSRFLLCNMPVAINAGLQSQKEMIGKSDFDFFSSENAAEFFESEQEMMKSGKPIINKEQRTCDIITGKTLWSLTTKVPLRNSAGKAIGLIGINRDITERKIAGQKLEEVNKELNLLFNSIDEVFFSVNMLECKVIQISKSCEKLYGYMPADFLANYKLWLEIIHPEDKHIVENENDMMKRGEQINNQYRIIRKDKTIRWVETKITPTLNDEGKLIRVDGITRDITERKNSERALSLSQFTVENATHAIYWIKPDGTFYNLNNAACLMLGYTFDELMALSIPTIDPLYNKEVWRAHWEDLRNKKSITLVTKHRRKDKALIDVQVDAHYFKFDNMEMNCAFVYDITERTIAEELLQKSQASLALNNRQLEQKNKELEQFAYVASHDLQEPLRTTVSFVDIFKQQYYGKLDTKADQYLTYIVQASDRMRVLIKDLLDFSRIGHNKDLERVDCNKLLTDVIADIDIAIQDAGATIISEDLPVLSGYNTELKQLFQNLIINSIKFRKKDVCPVVNISAQKKGDHWQFAFADNGIGIDQKHSERIFIIFQRLHTRSEYQGSGIGLSHCKKIVELHHGKIWVNSALNEGSTFYFTIHSPKEKIHESKIKLHNAN